MLNRKKKLVALTFSVVVLSILIYVINHGIKGLPLAPQLVVYASLPVAGGLITLSSCSLLGAFTNVEHSATSQIVRRISGDPTRNFFIGFLVAAYLSLIRPPLIVNLLFIPYIEWVAIALAVYMIYTMPSSSTTEFHLSSESPSWKRHTQEVRRETGRDLISITSVMEQFVDHRVKEPLLIYLALHLQRLGETEENILKTLRPLMDYQKDARRHKWYFLFAPWRKRKLALRNKKARENLLNTLFEKIDRLRSE